MLMVFCRQPDEEITRQQVEEAVVDGVFFAETPRFEPPLGSTEAHDPKWETLVIRYSGAKRPVVVIRTGPIVDIDEIIEEDFGSRPLDSTLQRRLVEARQVFILDVNPDSLTDEAWEMCDFIEHFIANRCDGLDLRTGRRDLRRESAACRYSDTSKGFPHLGRTRTRARRATLSV